MIKKIVLSLLIALSLFIVTGCEKVKENNGSINNATPTPTATPVTANIAFGSIKSYVPTDFEYRPDLRGLIYSENERKLYIKGNPEDRSEAIIVDLMKQAISDDLDTYVERVNKNLKDVYYVKIKDKPLVYIREKYQGKSGDTIIYNYTYFCEYRNYLYTITISGPQKSETDLNTIKDNILKTLEVENY